MQQEMKCAIERDGLYVLNTCLARDQIDTLISAFAEQQALSTDHNPADAPVRVKRGVPFARRNLLSFEFVRRFISASVVADLIQVLAPGSIPVRGILFDKSGSANWAVPWHQDRSIAVREKRGVPGFGPWSEKAGIPHVQPTVQILKEMLTLRFSLDPCGPDNGPLRAIPGTHRCLLDQQSIDATTRSSAERLCTTEAGGVVIMRPLLLHASSPAKRVSHRRVLHLEFGQSSLPGGLEWAVA